MPKQQYTQTQQLAVDAAKSQFKTWRIANGNHRRRIPDELRAAAIELSKCLSNSRASKELGINPTELKHWGSIMAPEQCKELKFAEVTLHKDTYCLECRVEVSREQTHLVLDFKGVAMDQMITLIRGVL